MAPLLEIKLGLGGESYAQVIRRLHLPSQLAQVDPIVASFTGGGVGVLSALLIVEANNIKKNKELRCSYCDGRGFERKKEKNKKDSLFSMLNARLLCPLSQSQL